MTIFSLFFMYGISLFIVSLLTSSATRIDFYGLIISLNVFYLSYGTTIGLIEYYFQERGVFDLEISRNILTFTYLYFIYILIYIAKSILHVNFLSKNHLESSLDGVFGIVSIWFFGSIFNDVELAFLTGPVFLVLIAFFWIFGRATIGKTVSYRPIVNVSL